MMKVILLKDVPKIGRRHDVKDVSSGHAINFLIPRGFAEGATAGALKRLETARKQDDERRKIQEDLVLKNLNDLDGVTIEMVETANEQGHLFAGIHKNELAEAIKAQTRLEVLPEHILLEKPIKLVGDHNVEAKIRDVIVKFKVSVKNK